MWKGINLENIKDTTSFDTNLTRGVGHAMNVRRACLRCLIPDVENGTSTLPSITFSTLTRSTSSAYDTQCMVEAPSNIFPNATNYVECWCWTYNPIFSVTWATCSSPDRLTPVSALLSFVLTRAPNTFISAWLSVETFDPFCDISIIMASFNSFFHASRLWFFSSLISFLTCSLRLPIISAFCSWLMETEEVLEARDVLP